MRFVEDEGSILWLLVEVEYCCIGLLEIFVAFVSLYRVCRAYLVF